MIANFFNKIIEPKNQISDSEKLYNNNDLLKLIVPIIIEQFLVLLVGLVDTMMVSFVGEAAVSGVSLINQMTNIFIVVFNSLSTGGAVVISYYIGKKDSQYCSLCSGQLIMIISAISILIMGLLLTFGNGLFHLLFGSVETAVFDAGTLYLKITTYSFLFLAIYSACTAIYRSIGDTKTLMYVSIAMNALNVIGNAIGVYVLHAGVAGVAVPTLISRVFASVVMTYLCMRKKASFPVSLQDIFRWNSSMLTRIFRLAIPGAVEGGLFQLAKVALSSIVALFGTIQIAANGVAQSFWSMAALFTIAMGPAFITVIGWSMGAGKLEVAKYYMNKLLRMTYLGTALWNLFFGLLTPLVLKMYCLSDETIQLVIVLVVLHNVGNAAFAPIAFAMSNGLRATGDAKFTMYASVFTSCICRVGFSMLFGIVLNLGVLGVTIAMICDWAIKACLVLLRYRSGKWIGHKVI